MSAESPQVQEALADQASENSKTKGLTPGYRQTEAGMIPEDWQVKKLGALGAWKGGMTPSMSKSEYWEGGTFPWVSSSDVRGAFVANTALRISERALDETSASLLPKNCILVVTRSGILRRYLPVALNTVQVAVNQDIKALAPNRQVEPAYLLQVLLNDGPRILSSCLKSGTTVESLEFPWLQSYLIPFPPLPEQRAIATALSDVDDLISALDKLIAKKRAVKTAAMQQLLTGKQRLPGFSSEWETRRLGDVFSFLSTANNPRKDLSEYGEIGYVHYGDLHATASSFLDCSRTVVPRISRNLVHNVPLLKEGDLIMVDASEDYEGVGKTVEVKNLNGRELVAGLHTLMLRGDKKVLSDGFKGYLQYIPRVRSALMRLATGISVYGISKSHVRSVEVSLPPVEEQTAIAGVLSDMDAEIEALEARRDKTREVKQGMMQELLTGRTRLV